MSATHSIHALAQFIVESSFETNDGLDVGQDSKRYKNRSKTGVETPKGIFFDLSERISLYEYAVTMVDFVLNYLCGPSLKGLGSCLHIEGLILYFYRLISLAFTWAAKE